MFAVGKQFGTGDEQIIYEHFLFVVGYEPAARVLERFQQLLIDGVGYSDRRLAGIIEKLATSKSAERDFPLMLNRCCYILINHWQMQSHSKSAIVDLIKLLDSIDDGRTTYAKLARRLRQLIYVYTHSDDYLTLKRLNVVLTATESVANQLDKKALAEQPLGKLITRYPYLYEHSLVSEERTRENIEAVKRIQQQTQKEYELSLSQYLTYQLRRARLIAQLGREAVSDLPAVNNPTLLSTQELGMAFGQFAGKAEGGATYKDLSRKFICHIETQPTIQNFKDDLYQYLISGVDSKYGQRSFNDRFYKVIKNMLPDRNGHKLDEVSLLRACTQILNYITIESSSKPQHFVFMDLITNIGAVFTTGLLLKLVLICHKAKPLLESRLSILFNHYESTKCKGIPWLVKSLETWNVAGSIHFGKLDTSPLNFLNV
jgi:hypothetical protein